MTDKKRLGNNIRTVRKAFHETQKELGMEISETPIQQSLISDYENGERDIPLGILEKIAKHYCVTIEELLYSDLSKYDLHLNEKSINAALKHFNIIFPLFSPKEALTNHNFLNAYTIHKKLYEILLIGYQDIDLNENLESEKIEEVLSIIAEQFKICLGEYASAYNNGNNIVKTFSAINYIVMNNIISLLIKSVQATNESTIIYKKICQFLPSSFVKVLATSKTFSEILNYAQYMEMMRNLKNCSIKGNNHNFADLFNYFQALELTHNIADNTVDLATNNRKGYDMLKHFSNYDNIYAKRYLKYLPAPSN